MRENIGVPPPPHPPGFRSITHMDKWTDIHTFYPGDTNREGTTNNVYIHTMLFKQVTENCAGSM